MLIRRQTTNLLQIFCELSLYTQVIFKSMRVADDTFQITSECEWVKRLKQLSMVITVWKYNPAFSLSSPPPLRPGSAILLLLLLQLSERITKAGRGSEEDAYIVGVVLAVKKVIRLIIFYPPCSQVCDQCLNGITMYV